MLVIFRIVPTVKSERALTRTPVYIFDLFTLLYFAQYDDGILDQRTSIGRRLPQKTVYDIRV